MDIRDEFKKYPEITSLAINEEWMNTILSISDEQPNSIIPSITLGTDGPALSSIFISTENYLAELRFGGEALDCDFVSIHSIRNYRFQLWEQALPATEAPPVIFQMATIQLIHYHNVGASVINYAGPNRSAWLANVLTAIPLKLLVTAP